jgi:hypothetical protein
LTSKRLDLLRGLESSGKDIAEGSVEQKKTTELLLINWIQQMHQLRATQGRERLVIWRK